MTLERPKIIVVEGIDGAGKTTLVNLLCETLTKEGYVIKTKCLKGMNSSIVRYYSRYKMCYENQYMKMSAYMLDLMLNNKELDEAKECDFVIYDRYIDTLEAYFGSLNVYIPWVSEMKKYIYEPYLTILLDVPVEEALDRIAKRGTHREELENIKYLSKVREKYFLIADNKPYVRLDALQDTRLLCDLIMKEINLLGKI